MIRFLPDTPMQALTRFFDMAAPDANVYVEIPAPDVRTGAILLLALAAVVLWRRLGPGRTPVFAMLALLLLSAVVWLATSGNGRYFLPMLVCAGPTAIALLCLLPLPRHWKGILGLTLASVQVFVLTQQPPWHQWSWLDWKDEPYFAVQLAPEQSSGPPTTYASLSTISYSLIAPQFPANSRWIHLASGGATPRDAQWTDAFLRRAAAEGPLRLIAPSLPSVTLADGKPNADVLAAFDKLIAGRNVRIVGDCQLLPSRAQARLEGVEDQVLQGHTREVGFWSCPLAYEQREELPVHARVPPEPVRQTLARMGALCPRFFPPNDGGMLRLVDGWEKNYSASETRLYVMDNDDVWYKFWRSLNPVKVGKVADVLAGKVALDCASIRGDDRAWRTGAQ